MKTPVICCVLLGACAACFAQIRLEFEVASIKPSGPKPSPEVIATISRIRRGPVDLFFPRMALVEVVMMGYGLERHQVFIMSCKTNGTISTRKLPRARRRTRVKVMWQNLLADRFHLVYHRESSLVARVMPVWELTVAKGGVKMLDSPLRKSDDPRASPLPEQRAGGPLFLREKRTSEVTRDRKTECRWRRDGRLSFPTWPVS
jgi:uncharacterized protein (TIGR03435 family)